jgi:3-mercaptopyruvate sulfurtransferase SseA
MGAEKFTDLMSGLGVSDDTIVVCYDDWVTAYATRLWWVGACSSLPRSSGGSCRRLGSHQRRKPWCTARPAWPTTLGFFVLSLLGWDRVRACDAAMAEWANRDDTPLTLEPV